MPKVDIVGRHSVADALHSDKKILSLWVSHSAKDDPQIKTILKEAQGKNISIQVGSADDLARQFPETNPQGIVAQVDLGEPPTLKQILAQKRDPLFLLYPHFDYEQNVGAILRTAWATGVDAVIVGSSGVHEITPVVAKVSMGAAAYVPLICMSLFQALDQIKDAAVPIIGVEVAQGKPYYQTSLKGGLALVFGGEAEGISEPLSKRIDSFIHIPMIGSLASLNISVATAIILFDRLRQG